MKIILGSSSQSRKTLMQRLEIPFETVAPNISEKSKENENSMNLVRRLAYEKYLAVSERTQEDAVIICSDQVLSSPEHGHTIIGKPRNHNEAFSILSSCQSMDRVFHTSLFMINTKTQKTFETVASTHVRFRRLDDASIHHYIEKTKPFYAAGGIVAESIGIALFEHIQADDPTAIQGLPLIDLCKGLSKLHKPIWQLQTNKSDPN